MLYIRDENQRPAPGTFTSAAEAVNYTTDRMSCVPNLLAALYMLVLGLPALQSAVVVNARFDSPMRLSQIQGFSWSQCDDLPHPGKIESLSISPDPISITGDVTVAVVCSTSILLDSPLTLALTIEKKILDIWVKIPCLNNIGSCTYDACETLEQLFPVGQTCPEPLHTYGIPCHCPFKAGTYSLPSSTFSIPDVPLPSWLEEGDYRVKGVLSNANGEVGCANIELSLKSKSTSWWK